MLAALFANGQALIDETRTEDSRGFYVALGDTVGNIHFEFENGDTTSLEQLVGNVVLLQFTASWCSPCKEEMPLIESELWTKYKDKGLIVIGVDYDESRKKVRKLKKDTGISYPLALDPDARIFSIFAHKHSGVTRNVVLDKSGRIIHLTRHFEKEEFEKMVRRIEIELAENKNN